MLLEGKVVVVTGGGRGIGAAISRVLAREGASVAVNYFASQERAERVAGEIRELARRHGAAAIARLVALMRSENENVAVRAAEALLDRGYGRPIQALEHSIDSTLALRQQVEAIRRLPPEERAIVRQAAEIMDRATAGARQSQAT